MAAPLRGTLLTQGAALGGAFVSHLKAQLKDVRERVQKASVGGPEGTEAIERGSVGASSACDAADGFDGGQWRSAAAQQFVPPAHIEERRAPPRPATPKLAELSQLLAGRAERLARLRDTRGRAASAVRGALAHFGLHDGRGHAYELAGELARNPRFCEVDVARHQLQFLSAGAVVVWGRSVATRFGHAAVSLGDGREASDHVKRQTTDGRFCNDFGRSKSRFARNYRVFVLVDVPAAESV